MHKLNIALIAALFAAIVAAAFFFIPFLKHSHFLGWFYFPAILLSVVFSGGAHSPSSTAGWGSFVAYTLLYLVVFVVLYAFLLETYLLRRALHHLQEAEHQAGAQRDSRAYLEKVGEALAQVEAHRRRHYVLKNMDSLDLTQAPQLLAAQALAEEGKRRPVKRLMKRLESNLAAQMGSREAAAAFMAKLREDARTTAARASQAK